jgi:inosine-uridine nucleoside N-ribohydrolase
LKVTRVIIDMDGGIDDALALILALKSPELKVLGITAVSGNVPVEQATLNALRVVELLDRPDVWVSKGSTRPLSRDPIRAFNFHGKDGLGDSNLPFPKLEASNESALRKISETVSSSRGNDLTLICTGPLTNIARLIEDFPELIQRIEEIVVMGGAFGVTEYGTGNETAVAEFNIYSDPEAAKIVFETGIRLKAVGLDVTAIPCLELVKSDYDRIKKKKDSVSRFATVILESNIRQHGRFTLHDPMAVAAKIWPTLYKFTQYDVSVETKGEFTRGMTVADRRGGSERKLQMKGSVQICHDVDPRFKRLFLGRLTD